MPENADEFRMQRLIDLLHHGRHNRLEVRRPGDLVGDAPQQPLRVVTVTEKPAVDATEPPLAARAHDPQRRADKGEPPPA